MVIETCSLGDHFAKNIVSGAVKAVSYFIEDLYLEKASLLIDLNPSMDRLTTEDRLRIVGIDHTSDDLNVATLRSLCRKYYFCYIGSVI